MGVEEPGYYRFTIMPEDEECAPSVDSIYVPSAIDEVKITEFTEATIDACEMNAMVIVELNTPLPEVEFSWDDGPKTSEIGRASCREREKISRGERQTNRKHTEEDER